MDINNLYDAGEDLVEAVNDAVRRNDFSGLSSSIKKTVKDVSETIQRDVRDYNAQSQREDIRRRNYRNTSGQGGPHPYDENPYRRYRSTAGQAYGQRMSGAKSQPQKQRRFRTQKTPFLQKLVSRTSGSGKIFGGIFGMVIGTISVSQGFSTTLGATGVGRSTQRSVIVNFLLILMLGYMVTRVFYR